MPIFFRHCKACGTESMRRTRRSLLFRTVLSWLPYRPYHCLNCSAQRLIRLK